MGYRYFELPLGLLEAFVKGHTGPLGVTANPLPADARIVDAWAAKGGRALLCKVTSDAFEHKVGSPATLHIPAPTFGHR